MQNKVRWVRMQHASRYFTLQFQFISQGSPRIHNYGNPKSAQIIKNEIILHQKCILFIGNSYHIDMVSYQATGASALLPSELLDIGNHLTSTGSLLDFRNWVMILLSVNLYLRASEVIKIKLEHFKNTLFSVRLDGSILYLGLELMGNQYYFTSLNIQENLRR